MKGAFASANNHFKAPPDGWKLTFVCLLIGPKMKNVNENRVQDLFFCHASLSHPLSMLDIWNSILKIFSQYISLFSPPSFKIDPDLHKEKWIFWPQKFLSTWVGVLLGIHSQKHSYTVQKSRPATLQRYGGWRKSMKCFKNRWRHIKSTALLRK